MCRTPFGRSYGPVIKTDYGMNQWINEWVSRFVKEHSGKCVRGKHPTVVVTKTVRLEINVLQATNTSDANAVPVWPHFLWLCDSHVVYWISISPLDCSSKYPNTRLLLTTRCSDQCLLSFGTQTPTSAFIYSANVKASFPINAGLPTTGRCISEGLFTVVVNLTAISEFKTDVGTGQNKPNSHTTFRNVRIIISTHLLCFNFLENRKDLLIKNVLGTICIN